MTDDVLALRDALLDDLPVLSPNLRHPLTLDKAREVVAERLDALIAAAEARAALTPERLAAALVATTIFAGHAHDCPVWMNRMIELRGERVDLDTCTCWVKDEAPDRARRILAALHRDPAQGSGAPTGLPAPADRGGPEEPRVERCAVSAGSGVGCGFVRDGFRCNDTPIQHRYVCGLLHGHTMVCHPFTLAPTPPTPILGDGYEPLNLE